MHKTKHNNHIRPFPFGPCFKTSASAKHFLSKWVRIARTWTSGLGGTYFHMKDFVRRLVLTQRLRANKKCPIRNITKISPRLHHQIVKCSGSNLRHFFRNEMSAGSETRICKDGDLLGAAGPWSGTPEDFALQEIWEEGQRWLSLFVEFLAPWRLAIRFCRNSPWKA